MSKNFGVVMKLDYKILRYHVYSFEAVYSDGGEVFKYPNWRNASIYQIVAYLWQMIRRWNLDEYELRRRLENEGFGNTEIVSLLVNLYGEGQCEEPLWRHDGSGGLQCIELPIQ
ncbi:hypothetical protein [Sphingobium sp. BS19]|uniref:hypothetical protein n=1 Tax=Sphingobium sp. BS19 TaxID=3018973 RepID=UPI0022EFBBFB|nr:hypothetical protein [Sphingobium sp. BS19]GLI98894.1 hypothetical protein Sbs19_27120 [Sphingobium sp. BS19]